MREPATTISRRSVLGGLSAGGLVLGMRLGSSTALAATPNADAFAPVFDSWVKVGTDGGVTVLVNCCEMGQGAQLGFAQIVADELDADWATVSIEQAPVERTYYNMWDLYSTGGSGSIRGHYDKLRHAGAAARSMLISAAARRWEVPPEQCRTSLGFVTHPGSGRKAGYGALAEAAGRLPVPEKPPLKERSEWRFIGKPVERLDLQAIVSGTNVYGIDVQIPGMLVATIAQAPVFGSRLKSVDARPALAIRGVKQVVRIVGGQIVAAEEEPSTRTIEEGVTRLPDAVAVIASGYWPASKGIQALKPSWTAGTMSKVSSPDISRGLEKAMGRAVNAGIPPNVNEVELRRDIEKRLRTAPRRHLARYEVPFLSQSPLEPMNGTAWVRNGEAELWLPTQSQSTVREAVAKALGLPLEKVTIHTTQLGGGFGRRLESDYGVQAALLSKAAGAPVKLIWSRQEDTKHGFYRPAAMAEVEAALDEAGKPSGLRMRVASMDPQTYGGLDVNVYEIGPAIALEEQWNPGVPVGSWRSVAFSYNTFFTESFIDELAAKASTDPLEYRRQLLAKQPRMLRVLDAVAEASQWSKPPSPGRHRGVAILARAWRTFSAQVVELSVSETREIRVHKITCAMDCGTVINPDQARAQIEGGIIFALGAALAQEITIANGQVQQSTFRDYPVTKMATAPNIEVVLLESPSERIGGLGEPPVPPLAPALCNAVYAATGIRQRVLPLTKGGFTVAGADP